MEQTVEIFVPSRLYIRMGWAALAGALVCVLCGLRAPLAFIPALLCVMTAALLFWLAVRPVIRVGETQFNVGERAIAWREVREVNATRLFVPLVLRIKLTNSRSRLLIYPGDQQRIDKLLTQLRKNSYLASFNGVAYRDYWTWSSTTAMRGENPAVEQPVRMLTADEEDEIERMYQRLKTVGHLDSRTSDSEGSDNRLS